MNDDIPLKEYKIDEKNFVVVMVTKVKLFYLSQFFHYLLHKLIAFFTSIYASFSLKIIFLPYVLSNFWMLHKKALDGNAKMCIKS